MALNDTSRSALTPQRSPVQFEHLGMRPTVHADSWVAPTAVLSGHVTIGSGTRVLHGAVLTAEHGAQLRVGQHCVIMENAVLRAAGRFPLTLGDRVLVGPHAYISGATIGSRCFIATGAMVFNGAEIGEGSVLALDAKAHIATRLPPGSFVPIGFIAAGESGRILSPAEAPTAHEIVDAIGFTKYVFGWEPGSGNLAERYARALGEYVEDRPVLEG
jgi:carbonic anhydrase/acetyltransferase-like protein (isoleucine patch superfamily)